jgi:hypothetical protein
MRAVKLRRLVTAAALLVVVLPAVPAPAAQNPTKTTVAAGQSFYAFVDAGENLDVTFTKAGGHLAVYGTATFTVRGPGFTTQSCSDHASTPNGTSCTFTDLTSTEAGIWQIAFTHNLSTVDGYAWTINVQDGSTTVPGRVWSEQFLVSQDNNTALLELWYQSQEGYLYKGSYKLYNGVYSEISADATGVALKDTCVSAYESMDTAGTYADTDRLWRPPLGQCGDPYKIFFERPAADLPATASRWDGTTTWIVTTPAAPDLANLRFTPNSDSVHSGAFTFDVTDFTGQLKVQVDANGDGDYGDPEDVTNPVAAKPGPVTVAFDGKDGTGAVIPISRAIKAQAAIAQAGEIHFAQSDVELRGAMTVVAVNGPNAGSATLHWNDTTLRVADRNCSTPVLDGRGGVDSTNGVHGWSCGNNSNNGLSGSWGDVRVIDDWTYATANEAEELAIPGQVPELVVTKTVTSPPTPEGGGRYRLGYTLTVANHAPAAGAYSLVDELAFGAGVSVVSAKVASTGPGGIAVNSGWNGFDNTAVVSGQAIAGAGGGPTVHTYTVSVVVNVPAGLTEAAADCEIGAGEVGSGLLNRTTFSGALGVQAAEACVPAPRTTIDKELVDVKRQGANQFELIYSLVVKQGPGAAGVYDLTDQLKLGAPVTVTSTSVANSQPGGIGVNTSWNGAGDRSIATDVPIAAGATHGYDLRIGVTVDTGAVTPANADCALTPGETGTGALNTASVTVNDLPAEDSGCVPFPATSVAKEVASPPTPTGDGTFRTEYTLRVRNTGSQADTYDLDDTLAFSDAVTIVSAGVANSEPGSIAVNPNWRQGAAPDPRVATGVPIAAATADGATTHLYTVTVVFRVPAGISAGQADCTLAPGEAGTGLRNTATAIVDGDRLPTDTCVEAPRTLFDKELQSIAPNSDGTYTLRYVMTVDRYGNGAPYTLSDALRFPVPVTVNSAKVTNITPGSATLNQNWNGTTDPLVAADVPIADGARHTHLLQVVAAVNQATASPTDRDCLLTGGESGTGFANTASLATNGTTHEDSTCGEIPVRTPNAPSPIDITKDVAGPPVRHQDGTTSVVYRITVANRGADRATYDLADRLRLGTGVVVRSAGVVNTAPGGIATSGWNGTTKRTVTTGQALDAGAIHTYSVTLLVAVATSAPADQLDCGLTVGQIDTGLRNTATATGVGVDHTAATCNPVDVEVLPTSIDRPPTASNPPSTDTLPVTATLPVTGTTGVTQLLRGGVSLLLCGMVIMTAGRRCRAGVGS